MPSTAGRRRRAVKPPVIELSAEEVAAARNADTRHADATDGDPLSRGEAAGDTVSAADEGPDTATSPDATAESVSMAASGEPVMEAGGETPEDGDLRAEGDGADSTGGFGSGSGDGSGGGSDEPPGSGAAPEPAPEPAPLPTARRASLIAAGIVGALVSLTIYLGLYYGGILPRDRSTMIDALIVNSNELGRRIASLEASAARVPRRDVTRELAAKIKGIEGAITELGGDPKNAVLKRMRNLETEFEKLTAAAAEAPAAVSGELEARLKAAEDRLSAVEPAAPGDTAGTALANRLSAIDSRLAALEERPANTAGPGNGRAQDGEAGPGPDRRIAAIDAKLAELAEAVERLSKQAADTAGDDRLAGIEAGIETLKGEVSTLRGAVSSAGEEVDSKLAAVEKSIDARSAAESRTAAGALAVTALQRAVASGRPYSGELKVVRDYAPQDAALTVLEARASAGIPTLQAVRNTFSTLADDIMAAGGEPEGGLVDKLVSSAQTLVRVRPAGPIEGDGRGAIVARIEAALADGDPAEAERLWNTLDDEAKQVSRGWAGDLVARVGADQELEVLSNRLTASLGRPAAAGATVGN